jgi:C-terminal processing protease CtpA/Prc
MKMKYLAPIFALALALFSGAASAHRFHAGMVDISFNARTGNTELVHTYMAHDVEALLANLYGRQFDLSDPEDQELVRKYVEGRFWIAGQDKTKLNLRWVGMTADAEKITVFQEIDQTPLWKAGAIHDNVLIDFIPDQVNTVNLNEGNAVRTLTFDRNKLEQPAR